MKSMLKKVGLGIVLAATAVTAAAPAEAQRYGRGGYGNDYGRGGYGGGYNRGGYNRGGGALVAGIAGLAIGAAIASGNDRYRDRYYYDRGYPANYDRGYYNNHGYYPNDGYYAYSYRDRYPRCYTERRYDSYYGGPVLVRVCR